MIKPEGFYSLPPPPLSVPVLHGTLNPHTSSILSTILFKCFPKPFQDRKHVAESFRGYIQCIHSVSTLLGIRLIALLLL